MIRIRLAGCPRGKGRPRFMRSTGHAFTPAPTRSYESALRYAAQEAMQGRPPLDGALAVVVYARMPVPASWSLKKRISAFTGMLRPTTKPDVDNVLKTVDSLNQVVWRDDKQVVDAHVIKSYSDTPELVIEVTPLHSIGIAAREHSSVPALSDEAVA